MNFIVLFVKIDVLIRRVNHGVEEVWRSLYRELTNLVIIFLENVLFEGEIFTFSVVSQFIRVIVHLHDVLRFNITMAYVLHMEVRKC